MEYRVNVSDVLPQGHFSKTFKTLKEAENFATRSQLNYGGNADITKQGGMLSNIGQGIGNAFQGIKQGMANQGVMNDIYKFAGHQNLPADQAGTINAGYKEVAANAPSTGRFLNSFFNDAMAIPALGGALGTGALMAGGAGLMGGLLGNWALRQYGSTLVLKQEAESAKQIAKALEAAQINSFRN